MAFHIDKSGLKALNREVTERLRSAPTTVARDARTGQFIDVGVKAKRGEAPPKSIWSRSVNSQFTTENIRSGLIIAKKLTSGKK